MKKEKEVNAVENRIKETEAAKHTIKDSVFTNFVIRYIRLRMIMFSVQVA